MNGRLCRQASRPRRTREQQVDFEHIWKKGTRNAQTSLACTQLIQDTVKSWVRGKRAWFGGREKGKPIWRFLPRPFWGEVSYWDDTPPKWAKLSWSNQVHAMRDRKREGTHTITRKGVPRQTNKQNSPICLVMGSGTHTWWSASTLRPDKGG